MLMDITVAPQSAIFARPPEMVSAYSSRSLPVSEETTAMVVEQTADLAVRYRGYSATISSQPPQKSSMRVRTLNQSLNAKNISRRDWNKRSVTFHHVVVRKYARTVGDNPSVTNGPPLRYVAMSYQV